MECFACYACPSFCNCVFRVSAIMFKHSGVVFFSKNFGIVKNLVKVSIEITMHLGSLTGGNEIVKTLAVKTLWIRKKSES